MSGKVMIMGQEPITKNTVPVVIDEIAHNLIVQGPEHSMTHDGRHYIVSKYFADVDTDGYARIRFKTPIDKVLHSVFWQQGTAGLLRTVYRAPGFTHAAGNEFSEVNRNDAYRVTNPGVLQELCHTPDGSGSGTVFIPTQVFGAGGTQAFSSPGANRDSEEFNLDVDAVYLIEVQSLSDNNKIAFGMDYYWRS